MEAADRVPQSNRHNGSNLLLPADKFRKARYRHQLKLAQRHRLPHRRPLAKSALMRFGTSGGESRAT